MGVKPYFSDSFVLATALDHDWSQLIRKIRNRLVSHVTEEQKRQVAALRLRDIDARTAVN